MMTILMKCVNIVVEDVSSNYDNDDKYDATMVS